jgi:peroxiredoxin
MATSAKPGDKFPITQAQLLVGGTLDFASLLEGSAGLLLVVYRGKQCGYCKVQLGEIEKRYEEFSQRNIKVLAISADTIERAQITHDELALGKLEVAFGLDLDLARQCGLYISDSRKEVEMPQFSEPGIFLIRPDQTLEAAWVSSFAFPRPPLDGIIDAMDFFLKVDPLLPPRGSA